MTSALQTARQIIVHSRHVRAFLGHDGLYNYAGHARYGAVDALMAGALRGSIRTAPPGGFGARRRAIAPSTRTIAPFSRTATV
jgi:hypothetical protein